MFLRRKLGVLGAVIAAVSAVSVAVPAVASAAPASFFPASTSTCAPGVGIVFTAERVAANRIHYSTSAPLSEWNGAVVQWTNLATGVQGFALVNDPVPADVGAGSVLSMVTGVLPCFVSSGVVIS